MLLPFEGNGVDTTWEFRMPKAANQLDYRSIADVLVTIDYTALNSFDYRQQVIQTLNPKLSADRPISFRIQLADQWYDLHNPDQSKDPMTIRFKTVRQDFPANIDALKIQQILLYFVRADATPFEVPISHLSYTAQEESGTVGGSATSIDGIISTRRGNAGSWISMIGKSPAGEWELALPNTDEMKNRFKNEEIWTYYWLSPIQAGHPNGPIETTGADRDFSVKSWPANICLEGRRGVSYAHLLIHFGTFRTTLGFFLTFPERLVWICGCLHWRSLNDRFSRLTSRSLENCVCLLMAVMQNFA